MIPQSIPESLKTLQIPWVESPFFTEVVNSIEISAFQKDKLKSFEEEGIMVVDLQSKDLSEKIFSLNKKITPLFSDDTYSTDGNRIQDAWRHFPEVREIASMQRIYDWLSLIYQREPIPFQTLNFKCGTEQGAHSDTIHFHSLPHRFMAGVWIAFEDVDDDNGPLFYYPGSHKLPIFDFYDLGLHARNKKNLENPSEYYNRYSDFLKSVIKSHSLCKKSLKVKKGEAIIWAANLIHGGMKVKDKSRTRYSQVTHYYFENSLYYTPMFSSPYLGEYYLKDIVNLSTDRHVEHFYLGKKYRNLIPEKKDKKKRLFLNMLSKLLNK